MSNLLLLQVAFIYPLKGSLIDDEEMEKVGNTHVTVGPTGGLLSEPHRAAGSLPEHLRSVRLTRFVMERLLCRYKNIAARRLGVTAF